MEMSISPSRTNASNMLTIAQKSVHSANNLLMGIGNDINDVNEIIRKRKEHTRNLEELVFLLKQENTELQNDVSALKKDKVALQELLESRELEMVATIEENRLACEGEMDRVLEQHQQAIHAMRNSQLQLQEVYAVGKENENKLKDKEKEIQLLQATVAKLSSQLAQAGDKMQELEQFNKLLQSAHEEVMTCTSEKIMRDHAKLSKSDADQTSLLLQLQQLRTRCRDLEFENTLLKASLQQGKSSSTLQEAVETASVLSSYQQYPLNIRTGTGTGTGLSPQGINLGPGRGSPTSYNNNNVKSSVAVTAASILRSAPTTSNHMGSHAPASPMSNLSMLMDSVRAIKPIPFETTVADLGSGYNSRLGSPSGSGASPLEQSISSKVFNDYVARNMPASLQAAHQLHQHYNNNHSPSELRQGSPSNITLQDVTMMF